MTACISSIFEPVVTDDLQSPESNLNLQAVQIKSNLSFYTKLTKRMQLSQAASDKAATNKQDR